MTSLLSIDEPVRALETDRPNAASEGPQLLLEAAARIGARLDQSAIWSDDTCTWTVTIPDRSDSYSYRQLTSTAAYGVYQGTAGIAIFLAELQRCTGAAELSRVTEGALRHAVMQAQWLPASAFGFHSGRTGIAFALAQYARHSRKDEFLDASRAMVSPLIGSTEGDSGLDVIGGAAGAIPVLLRLSSWLDMPALRECAWALGERIIATARRTPFGWSWPNASGNVRDLTGLAHGASGFAHALLELYADTDDARFRFGADEAFRYERSHFIPEENNWPDNRNEPLAKAQSSPERLADFTALLQRRGAPPPFKPMCMVAWCHGAPGIGLVRLHAYRLLRDRALLDDAIRAIQTTSDGVSKQGNYSLCHGLFGNEETLIAATSILGEPGFLETVRVRAIAAAENFELAGRPWPSGVRNGPSDPSFMLGDAGIGYHLLRAFDPDTDSMLLPVGNPDASSAAPRRDPSDWKGARDDRMKALRARSIDDYFGRTLRVFSRVGIAEDLYEATLRRAEQGGESDVAAAAHVIAETIASQSDPDRAALLDDAHRADRSQYEATLALTDYSQTTIEALARVPADRVDWEQVRVQLKPSVALLDQWHDWTSFATAGATPLRLESPDRLVVHPNNSQIVEQRTSPFAGTVLAALTQSRTVAEVVRDVATSVEIADVDPDEFAGAVLEQIKRAYGAGFLLVGPHATRRGESA